MPHVRPGDLLCTRNAKGLGGRLIRLGAALRDEPNTVNHVVIVRGRNRDGVLLGVEGRPGGVGEVDCEQYLRGPYTIDNRNQPKTDVQRAAIVAASDAMLGTAYDWVGIARDAALAIGAPQLWGEKWDGSALPAHVVCSSLADWVYEHVGLAAPSPDRTCTPADWAAFILERAWL